MQKKTHASGIEIEWDLAVILGNILQPSHCYHLEEVTGIGYLCLTNFVFLEGFFFNTRGNLLVFSSMYLQAGKNYPSLIPACWPAVKSEGASQGNGELGLWELTLVQHMAIWHWMQTLKPETFRKYLMKSNDLIRRHNWCCHCSFGRHSSFLCCNSVWPGPLYLSLHHPGPHLGHCYCPSPYCNVGSSGALGEFCKHQEMLSQVLKTSDRRWTVKDHNMKREWGMDIAWTWVLTQELSCGIWIMVHLV